MTSGSGITIFFLGGHGDVDSVQHYVLDDVTERFCILSDF